MLQKFSNFVSKESVIELDHFSGILKEQNFNRTCNLLGTSKTSLSDM